jgi:hypothetical protein
VDADSSSLLREIGQIIGSIPFDDKTPKARQLLSGFFLNYYEHFIQKSDP